MPVTTTNLTAGPGAFFTGAVGSVEPVGLADVDTAVWTDVGGTSDGVTLGVSQDFMELEVDQVLETPERRLTKRETTLKTNLAETTLDNLALVLNQTKAAAVAGGFRELAPAADLSAYKPNYLAGVFDGPGTNGGRSRVIGRKLLSTEGTEFAYKKDDQRVYSVTFMAHFISTAIKSVAYREAS